MKRSIYVGNNTRKKHNKLKVSIFICFFLARFFGGKKAKKKKKNAFLD